jgi:hypothetical protein
MNEHHPEEKIKEYAESNPQLTEDDFIRAGMEAKERQKKKVRGEPEPIDENRDDPVTRLLNKNQSPMVIRKYQGYGWPLFVAIICDLDLSDLDKVVTGFVQECSEAQLDNIQMLRDWCGTLSERIIDHYNEEKYGSVEGIGIVAYWDKCLCSSLWGDHMTHGQCRLELFTLLNMMTNM